MLKTCTLIFLGDAYFSTLGTIYCRFSLREMSQRSMESLVVRNIASCCFLHSILPFLTCSTGLFHVSHLLFLSSNLACQRMNSQKPLKSCLVLYLPGSVRKDFIIPTQRDLWSPDSHLDSCAQHPQYLLTPSG